MTTTARWWVCALVFGCGADEYASLKPIPGPSSEDSGGPLYGLEERPALSSPTRFFRRAALDWTGHLPSPAAIARIEADPTTLDDELKLLLDDPQLPNRMVHVLDETWHLRIEGMPVGPSDYGWDETLRYTLARQMAEEPLRQMAHIIATDQSWDAVVTSATTQATPLLADLWPLTLDDPSGTDWSTATWSDHRPAAGVLSSNGLWWRYNTTAFNYNRTRAAAVARLLVCDDYLDLFVEFVSPSLTDVEGTETAIRTNEGCKVCHDTLDPLAATFFGFWAYDLYDPLELSRYHPEREPLGPEYLDVQPQWFGQPVANLAELGPIIARDPRFPLCAVETFAKSMWRRPVESEDFTQIAKLSHAFEGSGRRIQPLLLNLSRTEEYVGDLGANPLPDALPHLLSPDQLAAILDETVGFTWTHAGEEQLDSDVTGLRVALGGVDGEEVTAAKQQADANLVLAWRAAAEAAAQNALPALEAGTCPLLPGVRLTTTPDDPAFAPALSFAWQWLMATPLPEDAQNGLTAVWYAGSTPEEAWAGVLSALFLDPSFVTY